MSTAPQQPPKLGKYLLLKKLGGGGMGRVYLASMSGPMEFEKKVVVKTILPSFTENKDYTQLFLNEARLGARLSHSAIASIHELGEENGLYYLVMEYVDGWTLREAIKAAQKESRTLNPARVAEIFARVCEGLYYAHTLSDKDGRPLGVVHRDLSPQNVMISREGDVKIIDFGVARSDLSTNETVAGTIKGKLSYMSPEQSRGERVDARSDIFALGVLLYESLTNTNPFDRDSPVSILRAIETLEPVPLAKLDQSLGPFDPIIRRCLQKDRERRYPDCRELRMDLLAVLERARASQRDHLGSWVASILEGKAGAETEAPRTVERTLVEAIDPFSGPRDPGLALPDVAADAPMDPSVAEQATRLKPIAGPSAHRTVSAPTLVHASAPLSDDPDSDEEVSHVSGLRPGPSRLLLGALTAVAVLVIGAGLLWVRARAGRLPDGASDEAAAQAPSAAANPGTPAAPAPNPPAPAENPAPALNANAAPAVPSNPSLAREPTAAAGSPAATPPPPATSSTVAGAPPADAAPLPDSEAPPLELAAARRHHGRPHKVNEEMVAAPTESAASPVALLVKPIGDTHASDAYGSPIDPHQGLRGANLQVGALQVHLQALRRGGERTLSISSQPWAIASIDGVSRGKTPLASIPLSDDGVRLELIRPGMDVAAVFKIKPLSH